MLQAQGCLLVCNIPLLVVPHNLKLSVSELRIPSSSMSPLWTLLFEMLTSLHLAGAISPTILPFANCKPRWPAFLLDVSHFCSQYSSFHSSSFLDSRSNLQLVSHPPGTPFPHALLSEVPREQCDGKGCKLPPVLAQVGRTRNIGKVLHLLQEKLCVGQMEEVTSEMGAFL